MKRLVAGSVALIVLALVAPAASASRVIGPRPAPTPLAGVTEVVGGKGFGFISVVLRKPAEISAFPFANPSIKVRSAASFAGIALKQQKKEDGVEVIATRVATCVDLPCDERPLEWAHVSDGSMRDAGRSVTLPAGAYQLYVFSDGGPVRATLRLDGLDGTTTVKPDWAASGSIGDLDPYLDHSGPRDFYSAVAAHSFAQMGISLTGMIIETGDVSAGEVDSCLDERRAPMDVPTPHPMLCTGSGGWATWEGGDGDRFAIVLHYSMMGSGDYSHSINYRSEHQAKAVRGFQFSLDYWSGTRTNFSSGGVMGGGG